MNEEVREICYILNFDTKLRAAHDFSSQMLPFYTRNPERVKYTNGFSPIIGVIARVVNGKGAELEPESLTSSQLALDTRVEQSVLDRLFSPTIYREMRSSKLLQYLPLSIGNERKGEIRLGQFLITLLQLSENLNFVKRFSESEPTNLYEKVVFDSLKTTESQEKTTTQHFTFYDAAYYQQLFQHDIENFTKDTSYFYDHISELLKFYYFIYVSQTIVRISNGQPTKTISPLYFSLENESVSRSRRSVRTGYNIVYQHGQDLLTDSDVLNYLNTLIPDKDHFYWKDQILQSNFVYQEPLLANLRTFLPLLRKQIVDEVAAPNIAFEQMNLPVAVAYLRNLLVKRSNQSRETSSRYAKSFEAIAQQGFSRQHGRLGRTFSLSNHTVLMLTTAIVGNHKTPLNDVFKALEARGVFFDRITRDKVVDLFEQANVLEKLSDSGDAQYVRGIL